MKGKKERIRDIKEKGLLFRMERKVWENSLIMEHTIEGGKNIYILGIKIKGPILFRIKIIYSV